jgi:hypothetical protein
MVVTGMFENENFQQVQHPRDRLLSGVELEKYQVHNFTGSPPAPTLSFEIQQSANLSPLTTQPAAAFWRHPACS